MNTNEIQLFNFEETPVRMVRMDGAPWAVAADVCRVLELTNTSKALQSLAEDEKGITKSYTLGGEQNLTVINEPGLYRLIFRSNKPKAEAFRRWVFHEVLPALRKTGAYLVPGTNTTLFEWVKSKGVDLEGALAFGKLARKAARELGLRVKYEAAADVQYKMFDKTLLDWVWEQHSATLGDAPSRQQRQRAAAARRLDAVSLLADFWRGDLAALNADADKKVLKLTFAEIFAQCQRLGLGQCLGMDLSGGEPSPALRSSLGRWLEENVAEFAVQGICLFRGRNQRVRPQFFYLISLTASGGEKP